MFSMLQECQCQANKKIFTTTESVVMEYYLFNPRYPDDTQCASTRTVHRPASPRRLTDMPESKYYFLQMASHFHTRRNCAKLRSVQRFQNTLLLLRRCHCQHYPFTLVELFCILHMVMNVLIYILRPRPEVVDGDDNISAGNKVFKSRSERTLQSLYLMCEERRHRSPTRSSVFSDGSPNHSEDEKADTSPFGRVPNGSYLAPDSSDFRLIYQAATFVSERERGIHSATERHVPLPSDGLRSVHVQTTLYAVQYKLLTNAFTRFRR
ncbi:hypothetical protein F2P81_019599 [Scophthalmus maximus]|uniref:Uncharacterized protein n=1 Tax=Scophthalmus maximus TaxID=52904 RepID=A0A6A4SD47_SCOMX|nr:hypothetical protein F2P81_019599 [Scophthalmus maximus]